MLFLQIWVAHLRSNIFCKALKLGGPQIDQTLKTATNIFVYFFMQINYIPST